MFAIVAAVLPRATQGSALADSGAWSAIVAAGVAVILFGGGLVRWVLLRRDRPKLVLDFDPNDPECVQKRGADIQLRVRARNLGRTDATDVRLRIFDRNPPPGHDHYLRIRHDNQGPYTQSNNGVDCPGSNAKTIYFDVIFVQLAAGLNNVVFQYADVYLLWEQTQPAMLVPRVQHTFTLELQGREIDGKWLTPSATKWRLDVKPEPTLIHLGEASR
jgi:hypothetical protein